MKNSKYKLKKIKFIIKFSIILLIFTGVIILIINNNNKNNLEDKLKYINSNEWNNERYPENMPILLEAYKGDLKAQNIGKSLYYVANEYFPKINLELQGSNEKDIRKYYNNNSKEISMMLGSINEDEFVLLVNEILKIKTSGAKFEKYYLDIESIVSKKDITNGDLYIKYENSDEIRIKISVINYFKDQVSSVKYYK